MLANEMLSLQEMGSVRFWVSIQWFPAVPGFTFGNQYLVILSVYICPEVRD